MDEWSGTHVLTESSSHIRNSQSGLRRRVRKASGCSRNTARAIRKRHANTAKSGWFPCSAISACKLHCRRAHSAVELRRRWTSRWLSARQWNADLPPGQFLRCDSSITNTCAGFRITASVCFGTNRRDGSTCRTNNREQTGHSDGFRLSRTSGEQCSHSSAATSTTQRCCCGSPASAAWRCATTSAACTSTAQISATTAHTLRKKSERTLKENDHEIQNGIQRCMEMFNAFG